jgi:hypothetical protein
MIRSDSTPRILQQKRRVVLLSQHLGDEEDNNGSEKAAAQKQIDQRVLDCRENEWNSYHLHDQILSESDCFPIIQIGLGTELMTSQMTYRKLLNSQNRQRNDAVDAEPTDVET